MARKHDSISLDELNPLELEGTPEDIALVERGLAIMARKQTVWSAVVDGWKKLAGIPVTSATPPTPPAIAMPGSAEGVPDIASLIRAYRSDPRSPYHKVRFHTRENYESLLGRMGDICADTKLVDMKAQDFQRLHKEWSAGGKYAMARSVMTMMRMLLGFGATVLEDSECERLSVVLHKLHFEMVKPRQERMTQEQALALMKKAHVRGLPSIALAQALQFECGIKQLDVTGEWVPESEPGDTDIRNDDLKWLRGLRWSEIDQNLILRHTPSNGGKDIEVNLRLAPMVMEELARLGDRLPTTGAMIVYEKTGLPYLTHQFRREWRLSARAAGVPDAIRNMDSRRAVHTEKSNGKAHEGAPEDGAQPKKDRPADAELQPAGRVH